MARRLGKDIARIKRERNLYFQENRQEIAQQNIHMLRDSSLTVALLVTILIFLTPIILPAWTYSLGHILMIPLMLLFFLFACHYGKRKHPSYGLVMTVCTVFGLSLFAFDTVLNVLFYPWGYDPFMQLMVVLVPIIFILPMKATVTMLFCVEVMYAFVVFLWKKPDLARHDVFNAAVGFFVALPVSWRILRLRTDNYHVRCRFQNESMTDALTGILNKTNCENQVREYLNDGTPYCSLLILDVDSFKSINDQFGHQMGDEILEKVGAMLLRVFRTTDVIGRIGGDEFLILMKDLTQAEVMNFKCEALVREMKTITLPGGRHVSCSVGGVFVPGIQVNYCELFRSADNAMYQAKAAGKDQYWLHYLYPQVAYDANKLLIVEDDAATRAVLRNIFQADFEILEAPDGQTAQELLADNGSSICLILLDLVLPPKNGYEILKEVKSDNQLANVPVVVISADEHAERTVLQMGAADMIVKPVDPEIIRLRIVNVLKKRKNS